MGPLHTDRLVLRNWRDDDAEPFASMNADPEVMADLGGPLDRARSDQKLQRFAGAFRDHGYGRWVVELARETGPMAFLGYVGVMPVGDDHVLGAHADVGWRLCRRAWGHGFAVEAARAALADVHERVGLERVLSYTAPDNVRSQAVMGRLGLRRDPSLDFVQTYDDTGEWHGLVWVSDRSPTGSER